MTFLLEFHQLKPPELCSQLGWSWQLGNAQAEKKGLFSHLLRFFSSTCGCAGVGSVVPRHLLKHRSPLPVMAVARKINKQKDSNSICRTSPEPHIPENFGALEGRSRF